MKIEKFFFRQSAVRTSADRIQGTITMPASGRVVYVAAAPPKGELCAWAEVSEVAGQSTVTHTYVILKEGDEIPADHVYEAHILANPMLFLYRFEPEFEKPPFSHH